MARYGTFKYGSGQEYGTSPATTLALWTFIVDWDNDGSYTGENEADYMVDFSLSRGRDHLVTPNGQGFERYGAGRATAILDNTDGRFNPFNTSSPLYPHITPGKSVRIAVKNGSAGTDYSLMRGRIADIQPYNQGSRKMVKIDVVDGQQFLRDRTIKIGYKQSNPIGSGVPDNEWTTGRWVDLILERANWPESEWPSPYDFLVQDYSGNLVPGFNDTFTQWVDYTWFWLRNALESIRELEDAELGTFLHERTGQVRFLGQHFTLDQVVQLDESQILTDIAIPQPWETLRNQIQVRVNPIQFYDYTPTPTLWSVAGYDNDAIPIAAGAAITFEAEFRYGNFKVTPANLNTVLVVTQLADGTGSDLSSQCTFQMSEYGDGATIIVQNGSGTDGYIISCYIGGDVIYTPYNTTTILDDATSQGIYGTRAFKLESPWLQKIPYAETLAAFLLENLKDPSQYPAIKIETRPDIQFGLDLYVDVIHLTSDTLNIDALYRIGKIEHSWLRPTGQAVLTTLKLEPYFAVGASSELLNLLSPFDSAVEVDGATPPAEGRMLWTLDVGGFWVWSNSEGNPFGSLRHYLVNDAGVLGSFVEITSVVGRTIDAGDRFEFDYIWIREAGQTIIGGDFLILVEVVVTGLSSQAVYEFFDPSNYEVWQRATFDLNDYSGETIVSVTFTRNAGAGVGRPLQRILFDNVFIGR